MSHIPCTYIISYGKRPSHKWMSHIPCEWVISHVNESYPMYIHHILREATKSQMNESYPMWMSHIPCEWVISHVHTSYPTGSDQVTNDTISSLTKKLNPTRPTQSIIYVPLPANRFQKNILLIVRYKYSKSCSGDFILQNLILRTRSYGTGFITQSSWVVHFHQISLIGWTCFVPQL